MITIGITTCNEKDTIGRAIDSALNQDYNGEYEILVVAAGDDGTKQIVLNYAARNPNVRYIFEDVPAGKPTALNKLFNEAKGDIVILTDGDVVLAPDAVSKLIMGFDNQSVGAISGRGIPINKRDTLMGFIAHLTANEWHKIRSEQLRTDKSIALATGYLYGIRKNLFTKLPQDALSDDGYLSCVVRSKGYAISYVPTAIVDVKHPTNVLDFIKQKRRTRIGFYQLQKWFRTSTGRSAGSEIRSNFISSMKFIQGPKECIYFCIFVCLNIIVWLSAFFTLHSQKSFRNIWVPIISTKNTLSK